MEVKSQSKSCFGLFLQICVPFGNTINTRWAPKDIISKEKAQQGKQ